VLSGRSIVLAKGRSNSREIVLLARAKTLAIWTSGKPCSRNSDIRLRFFHAVT
jgi:hypothetical protein